MENRPKIIAIVGPTATGKSSLAVECALAFDGEVISADSRQVYRGLDIGSAKITTSEMQGVPHHLLDVADPQYQFSVADFKKLARAKIDEILSRGKLPILCGGTGFYISAVIDDIGIPAVPPDYELRKELEALPTDTLFKKLQEQAPDRAETIDRNNRQRLVRALEIVQALGSVPTLEIHQGPYDVCMIGLTLLSLELKNRISDRLDSRQEAMIKEVENLHEDGLSWERLFQLGLEYRYVSEYLQGKIDREAMRNLITTKSWQFAKRQMVWFKRNKNILWFNPVLDIEKILQVVKDFVLK